METAKCFVLFVVGEENTFALRVMALVKLIAGVVVEPETQIVGDVMGWVVSQEVPLTIIGNKPVHLVTVGKSCSALRVRAVAEKHVVIVQTVRFVVVDVKVQEH
jgi:hypothetical protein